MKKRLLTVQEAAEYCGLGVPGFRAAVNRGILPGTVPGLKRYDIHAIDKALNCLSGIVDKEEKQPELSAYDEWKASLKEKDY